MAIISVRELIGDGVSRILVELSKEIPMKNLKANTLCTMIRLVVVGK